MSYCVLFYRFSRKRIVEGRWKTFWYVIYAGERCFRKRRWCQLWKRHCERTRNTWSQPFAEAALQRQRWLAEVNSRTSDTCIRLWEGCETSGLYTYWNRKWDNAQYHLDRLSFFGFQVQWLNDLFQVMMKEYIHVGCNIQEIQMMKEEHQAFQETAKVRGQI